MEVHAHSQTARKNGHITSIQLQRQEILKK